MRQPSLFLRRKKIPLLCAVLLSLCSATASAGAGIGVQVGLVPSLFSGEPLSAECALTCKFDALPFVFAPRVCIAASHVSSVEFAMDIWVGNPVIGSSIVHFFYGPGLVGSWQPPYDGNGFSQDWQCFAGTRFVTGFNAFVSDSVELYGQTAFEMGIVLAEAFDVNFRMRFPVETGIRFWF
ncbi:MAG TPA: hypothetical protein DDW78_10625 [Treponema sp.]|nr:hypothetical protein [Treponema sp.]